MNSTPSKHSSDVPQKSIAYLFIGKQKKFNFPRRPERKGLFRSVDKSRDQPYENRRN